MVLILAKTRPSRFVGLKRVKGACLNQYEIKKNSALTFLEIEGGSDIVRGDVEGGE